MFESLSRYLYVKCTCVNVFKREIVISLTSQYISVTSFQNALLFFNRLKTSNFSDVIQATALYYEFSVNYQRLRFPIWYEVTRVTDLGIPVILQIRTSSLLSLRGRIKQTERGEARNADLDFRSASWRQKFSKAATLETFFETGVAKNRFSLRAQSGIKIFWFGQNWQRKVGPNACFDTISKWHCFAFKLYL